jgi:hypothetical protein
MQKETHTMGPSTGSATIEKFVVQLFCTNTVPDYILIDFEKTVIDVLSKTFPKSMLAGCWFHLSHSIFRNAQGLGLKKKYEKSRKFKNKIKLLSALSFVPTKDIGKRFQQLFAIPTEQNQTENLIEKMETGIMLPLQEKNNRIIDKRIKSRAAEYKSIMKEETFLKWIKGFVYYVPEQE